MGEIKAFFERFGLNDKEIEVYLACLELGAASVLTLSRRAGTKRPGTYLILDNLAKKGLVDAKKSKYGLMYHALHPKKVMTQLRGLESDYEKLFPQMMGLFHDREDKPVIGVYEDYDVYDRIADEVREYVASGKEALYFGNSEYFYQRTDKMEKWFAAMKNKRHKCREILCGDGPVQRAYAQRVRAIGNPQYQARQLKSPANPVVTEFAVWGDKTVFFSGTGKDLFTITIEGRHTANTHRAIFEQLWTSL